MFEQKVTETKLAGSIADCMFRRISGGSYEGDISFISTLRALLMHTDLGNRSLKFATGSMPLGDVASEELFASALQTYLLPDHITYVCVNAPIGKDVGEATQEFFSQPAPEDAHEFMDVRTFFMSKMACRAMICEQSRSSVILVLSSTLKKHHLAQCIIPKLLPWLFEDVQLTLLQRTLLTSLTMRYGDTYLHTIQAICDTDTYRQRQAGAAMLAFKRSSLEKQKTSTESQIRAFQERVDVLNSDLLAQYRALSYENLKLSGIMMALASDDIDDNGLQAFLAANNNVEVISMDGDSMKIMIKSYLNVYDPDAYSSIARNQHSWYWSNSATASGPFMLKENRKMVMDAIFSDTPTFKIRSFGIYTLNCANNRVEGSGGRYSDHAPTDRYANPHLYYASCLGSYRAPIQRALTRGDIVDAISQCIASAHSVNVTESATFRHLCTDIFNSEYPILEGPNGNTYTVRQAYEYLRDNQQQ